MVYFNPYRHSHPILLNPLLLRGYQNLFNGEPLFLSLKPCVSTLISGE
jgi:hypothetical protein